MSKVPIYPLLDRVDVLDGPDHLSLSLSLLRARALSIALSRALSLALSLALALSRSLSLTHARSLSLSRRDHHTRFRIIRTTPASSSSTHDPTPSRGWCPIANATPLCVSLTQSRPAEMVWILLPAWMVRRSAPVDESHTLQVPSLLPVASLLPST